MENTKNNVTTQNPTLEELKAARKLAEAERKAALAKRQLIDQQIADLEKVDAPVADAEAPVLVEEATEEVVEAPAEEVVEETTEEVVEAPAEEVAEEATEEVVEAPAVEDDAPVVDAEAPAVEDDAPVVDAEAPVVEDDAPVVDAEAPTEEVAVAPVSKKKSRAGVIMGAIALATAVIALCVAFGNRNNVEVPPTGSGSQVEAPANPEAVVSEGFKNGIVNIANTLTNDESIAANVDILVEKIGEDKLAELVGKYGELSVQKGLAQLLAFAPEVKMYQYIGNNELDYNPNAEADYSAKLLEATEAYRAETGKNPDGALMSLDGYDTHKFNREAMKELIAKSGDTALLTWYEVKTSGYDVMVSQKKDTANALAYKETVKTEMLNSQGTADLLELQLEQEANGTLTVMDDVTMQYTESYNNFIIANYIYVIAK